MVPDDCVTSGDDLNWVVHEDKSDQMSVCYDGHTFFVGFPTFTGLSSDDNPERLRLWALPGGENDELDGSKWGGLTLEDLVIRYALSVRNETYLTYAVLLRDIS